MKPYQVLFRNLNQSTNELTIANEQLQHEITERKRAEDSIRLAYTELDQIFNTAADGMCVIDKEHSVIRVNDTLCTMLDISKEEALGKKCYQILRDSICGTSMCPITYFLEW